MLYKNGTKKLQHWAHQKNKFTWVIWLKQVVRVVISWHSGAQPAVLLSSNYLNTIFILEVRLVLMWRISTNSSVLAVQFCSLDWWFNIIRFEMWVLIKANFQVLWSTFIQWHKMVENFFIFFWALHSAIFSWILTLKLKTKTQLFEVASFCFLTSCTFFSCINYKYKNVFPDGCDNVMWWSSVLIIQKAQHKSVLSFPNLSRMQQLNLCYSHISTFSSVFTERHFLYTFEILH